MHSLDLLNNRDVLRICALHKEKGEACTESAMPGVQGREIRPLDRAIPLPSHVLNRALVFGQYLILNLKGCVRRSVYLPWRNKMLSCTYYSLNVFLQDSPLSLLVLGASELFFFLGQTEL